MSTPITRPAGAHHLRRDEADLAGAAAEVEDGLALPQVAAGIAAAVVPFEDLLRDHREIARVVVDRAAEVGHALLGPLPIALADDVFDFHPYHRVTPLDE